MRPQSPVPVPRPRTPGTISNAPSNDAAVESSDTSTARRSGSRARACSMRHAACEVIDHHIRVPRQLGRHRDMPIATSASKELAVPPSSTPGPFCLRVAVFVTAAASAASSESSSPARDRRSSTADRLIRSTSSETTACPPAPGLPDHRRRQRVVCLPHQHLHSRSTIPVGRPAATDRRSTPCLAPIPVAPVPISTLPHDPVPERPRILPTRRSSPANARGSISTASTRSSRRNASGPQRQAPDDRLTASAPACSRSIPAQVRAAFGAATTAAVAATLRSRVTAPIATAPTI